MKILFQSGAYNYFGDDGVLYFKNHKNVFESYNVEWVWSIEFNSIIVYDMNSGEPGYPVRHTVQANEAYKKWIAKKVLE